MRGEHPLSVWWGADVATAALAGTADFGKHGGVSDAGARGDTEEAREEEAGSMPKAYVLHDLLLLALPLRAR